MNKLARLVPAAAVMLSCAPGVLAQVESAEPSIDKGAAYYHYSLGHLYTELAGQFGNRGDFVDKAIENFRLALKADPGAAFLSEQLSDLYIQAGRLREAVVEAEGVLKEKPDDLAARRLLARIYTRLIGDSRRNSVNEEMVRKAIEQYRKIAELQPQETEVWLMLGRLHKLNHSSVESEDAYRKALELDAGNEDALIGLAMVYADLGDQPRAAETLRQVTGKKPSLRTLTFLAGTYEKMEEFSLAAETYRQALALAPDNSELGRAYAQSLLQAGKPEEAMGVFEKLARDDPKDHESNLRLAQIYRQRGKLSEARRALDAALAAAPDNLEVQYNQVNLLEAEGKPEEAIALLEDILKDSEEASYSAGAKTNRAVFLERLGLLYRAAERAEDAIKSFRELEKLDPEKSPRVAAQVADTYRQVKRFDEAYAVIDEAFQKHPDDTMIAMIRATVLADLGRSDEAVAAVQALTKGERDRDSYLTEAQIYERAKRFDLMGAVLEKALDLSKSEEEKAATLFLQGAMYERQKRFEEAEAVFQEVLRLNPDNPAAMNYLGYMYADRNVKLEEARDLIRKALEYEPNNGAYLDSLGWVYYRMGRVDEAEEYLRRAIAKVARDPVVHDHLADVYFKQGKLREAIAHWKLSLEEWRNASESEKDPAQIASVQKKLEGAEIRLAKEASAGPPARP